MTPRFYIEREKERDIFYKEYTNGTGHFGFHSPIELYIVNDGEMEVYINDQKRILRKNQMSVALSFDAHTYKTLKSSKSCVLIIPTYMCEEFSNEIKHKRTLCPYICDEKIVVEIKRYVKKLSNANLNPIEKKGYIYTILGIILNSLKFEVLNEIHDTDLSTKILMYINDNCTKDITLENISGEFGYNKSYLSRYFKTSFGIGINKYITMLRLKKAIMLMQEKKHNLTYCALESGFNSMRTFYRVFADEFGCTPKEYLKRYKI